MQAAIAAAAMPERAGVARDAARSAAGAALFDAYRIERLLGGGRPAKVYLARDRRGGRVALKVADRARAGDAARQLAREHLLLSRVSDPRVVRVHEHRVTARCAWLAMEYIVGGSLRDALHGPQAPAAAVRFVREAAQALAPVHAAGIVHRDLKPENLLLRADGSLVLADFGVAALHGDDRCRPAPGTLTGTLRYAAPEQLEGAAPIASADVYSLGVMLYELLRGRAPFVGATPLETIAQHLAAPVPRLPAAFASCQPILDRLLDKRPLHRPRDAGAVLTEIQDLAPDAPEVD
jgi:eukaryotic-like serine/threonine-protein kinase